MNPSSREYTTGVILNPPAELEGQVVSVRVPPVVMVRYDHANRQDGWPS